MKKYSYVKTNNTAIISFHDNSPLFLNETASEIFDYYIDNCTNKEIIEALSKKYPDVEQKVIENAVEEICNQLDELNIKEMERDEIE